MVLGIVHRFPKLASASWMKGIQPVPELFPYRLFQNGSLLFTFSGIQILQCALQIEEFIAIQQSDFCWNQLFCFFFIWKIAIFDCHVGVDVQKLQLFSPGCWNGLEELPSCMCKTAYQCNIFQPVVTLVSVTLYQSIKSIQKVLCTGSFTAWLVIIEDDRCEGIISGCIYQNLCKTPFSHQGLDNTTNFSTPLMYTLQTHCLPVLPYPSIKPYQN